MRMKVKIIITLKQLFSEEKSFTKTKQHVIWHGTMAFMMFCDRRLKRNAKPIGKTSGGTQIYSFNYVWGGPTRYGPMADEVPHAVVEYNGIKQIDVSKVI